MPIEVPVTQARAELAELVNRVVYAGERVVLTRHGQPVAALISAGDLQRLDGLPAEQSPSPITADTGERQAPIESRPPLRIAAQHPASDSPGRSGDHGTGPWL